jgi:hypothetical protein
MINDCLNLRSLSFCSFSHHHQIVHHHHLRSVLLFFCPRSTESLNSLPIKFDWRKFSRGLRMFYYAFTADQKEIMPHAAARENRNSSSSFSFAPFPNISPSMFYDGNQRERERKTGKEKIETISKLIHLLQPLSIQSLSTSRQFLLFITRGMILAMEKKEEESI